jgi:hypothetical protein
MASGLYAQGAARQRGRSRAARSLQPLGLRHFNFARGYDVSRLSHCVVMLDKRETKENRLLVVLTVQNGTPNAYIRPARGRRSDSSRSLSSYGLLTKLREFPFMLISHM